MLFLFSQIFVLVFGGVIQPILIELLCRLKRHKLSEGASN